MEQQIARNIRLGLFVLLGTLLLVAAFYFIGAKQNLFGSSFRLNARFRNVNGLMAGNNVRFAGIDVGTVEALQIVDDSTVLVRMVLDLKVQPFLRRSCLASVGTDGLMGNRLVNVSAAIGPAPQVADGDELATLPPLEMDDMMRTLNITNTNMAQISTGLADVTSRISRRNSFWKVLMDTSVAEDMKSSVLNLKLLSGDLRELGHAAADRRSSLRRLAADTLAYGKVMDALNNLALTGDSARRISTGLAAVVNDLRNGRGTVGQALTDTSLMVRLNAGLQAFTSSARDFDTNMVALQYSWPFKRYFKSLKKKREAQQDRVVK